MSILKIARLGHPVLKKIAEPLEIDQINTQEIKILIKDMFETMAEYDGIGLAAPQVHVSKQIIIMGGKVNRYKDSPDIPKMVLINPKIQKLTEDKIEIWEGCLSLPDLRGKVPRIKKIKVDYVDQNASPQTIEAENFIAIVLQHEIDHLLGKTFVERMKDMSKLAFQHEFQRYLEGIHNYTSQ